MSIVLNTTLARTQWQVDKRTWYPHYAFVSCT